MIIPGQFGFNCPSGFREQISVFYADRKSKMAASAGHRLTLDPMRKYSNAFFSETTNMIKGTSLKP
jgi:cyclopropane fatty-acyl-phospholipid synthase-like methyltransferase